MSGLLILILLFGAVWVMFLLPARRRRAQHASMQESVEAWDEIITAGGIHGRVVTAEDEVVEVEIAPAVKVKLDRRAVAAVARDVEVEADEEPAPGAPAEPR